MQCVCAVLSSVACPALQYFPTLFHKRHDFRRKCYRIWNACFDFLYRFHLQHFPFCEELNGIWSKIYIGFHVKYPLFFCNEILSGIRPRQMWRFSDVSGTKTAVCLRKFHWILSARKLQDLYPLFLSDFNETWIFSTDFRKIVKYRFHENPSSEGRVVPCGWTDRQVDRRADMK